MSDLFRDFRYAVRSIRRSPALRLAVLLVLAVGIAAPDVIFSQSRVVPPQNRTPSPKSLTEELSKSPSFTFQISPDLPEFTFKVIPKVDDAESSEDTPPKIDDIEVFRGDSKGALQHLAGCDWYGWQIPRADSYWFRADDFNFDGFKDIYVTPGSGGTGNESGCVWLFDPSTGRFKYSDEFSDVGRYWLDPETKTIFTFEDGGMVGMVHSARKYTVQNNHLVLIWSEDQGWDAGKKQFHCVQKERRGKHLATGLDQWIDPAKGDGPCVPGKLFPFPPSRKPPN